MVLPAPLGPIEGGDGAPLDLEVVDVDRGEAAEAPTDAVGDQDRVGLGHPRLGDEVGERRRGGGRGHGLSAGH